MQEYVKRRNFLALCEVMHDCLTPLRIFLKHHLPIYVLRLVSDALEAPPAKWKGPVDAATPVAIARSCVAPQIAAHVSDRMDDWDWSVILALIASVPYLRRDGVMHTIFLRAHVCPFPDCDSVIKEVVQRVRDLRNKDFGHLGGEMTTSDYAEGLMKVQLLLLLCGAPEDGTEVNLCRAKASPRPSEELRVLEKLEGIDTVYDFTVHGVLGFGGFGIVFLVRALCGFASSRSCLMRPCMTAHDVCRNTAGVLGRLRVCAQALVQHGLSCGRVHDKNNNFQGRSTGISACLAPDGMHPASMP
jgi:hypothetical protein